MARKVTTFPQTFTINVNIIVYRTTIAKKPYLCSQNKAY